MTPREIETNAQTLYFNFPNSYFAKGNQFKEIKPFCLPLLGRLIFVVVDFFKRGAESKKVHDLALTTLKAMDKQMDGQWPKWHFNGDERFGMYAGCPVLGHTYKDLAEHLIKDHPVGKYQDIKDIAQSIIVKFDNLSFFNQFPSLTKRDLIQQATYFDQNPNKPSVSKEDVDNIIAAKRTFSEIIR